MKKLVVLLALGALAALLVAVALSSALSQLSGPSWAELERERLAVERAQAVAPVETFAAQALALAPVVVIYAVIGLGAVGGALALARFRHYARPDAAGRLPVALLDQPTARDALAGFHAAQLAAASRQPVPHSITYSRHTAESYAPRVDYRYDGTEGRGPALLPAADDTPAAVPSFGELLSRGRIGRGQPLLLGFEAATGAEIPGQWLDLYATATAGLPGSGKTTSQRFFAAQTALHGAKFVVCDPHAGAADDSLAATLDPLRAAYLCEPAEEPKAILQAVRYVADIGEARVKGRDNSRTPIILWVDELTGLLGRSDVGDELAELLELIAQEYRKRWVYLSASGQIWTAARTSSELRDSLASVLCHRMKRGQARLLLPTEEAAEAERLATGEAILWRTNGATTRVRIPNTTGADVRAVAALLTDDAPTMGRLSVLPTVKNQPSVSQAPADDYSASGSGATPSAEAARVVALFLAGQDAGQIVTTLTGMTSKAGRPYLTKLAEVQAAIRESMKGGQAA